MIRKAVLNDIHKILILEEKGLLNSPLKEGFLSIEEELTLAVRNGEVYCQEVEGLVVSFVQFIEEDGNLDLLRMAIEKEFYNSPLLVEFFDFTYEWASEFGLEKVRLKGKAEENLLFALGQAKYELMGGQLGKELVKAYGSYIVPFDQLKPRDLYWILQIRQEVFMKEQQSKYYDLDGIDLDSYHMVVRVKGKPVGTLRIIPPGLRFEEWAIGRFALLPDYRGIGAGSPLMEKAIAYVFDEKNGQRIRIEAQNGLRSYYEKFGFEADTEVYNLDGIDHLQMVLERGVR